jgi:hypothetical protein
VLLSVKVLFSCANFLRAVVPLSPALSSLLRREERGSFGCGCAALWPESFPGSTIQIPATILSGGFYTVSLPLTNQAGFFRLTQ